jgi:hypothetical protein
LIKVDKRRHGGQACRHRTRHFDARGSPESGRKGEDRKEDRWSEAPHRPIVPLPLHPGLTV